MDARLYDELWRVEQEHWWFRARREIVWSLVRRYIQDANTRRLRVCELGCGTGGNLAAVADRHDVWGVECSPHALEYARRLLGDRVICGSLPDNVDLPVNTFDVVLLTDVLEHVRDDAASAQIALKLLRPGGVVVATVPAYQWLYSPRDKHHHHFRRYSKPRFRSLWTRLDCQALVLSHYNSLLFAPAVVARLASRWSAASTSEDDLKVPARPINSLLTHLFASERYLLARMPMPCGLSLVGVIRKAAQTLPANLAAA